jgi:hypothetical protein
MRFPAANESESERDTDRRIHWHQGGGEVVTLRADRNEPVFGEVSPDVSMHMRAFNEPILSFQGRVAVRMPLEDTRELLASYLALIDAQERVVDANKAKLQRPTPSLRSSCVTTSR